LNQNNNEQLSSKDNEEMDVSPGDLVLQEADIVDVEHDAQVEVRVLSIFVKLLLQRPIQLNPSETRQVKNPNFSCW
jgi:hypothetical protein